MYDTWVWLHVWHLATCMTPGSSYMYDTWLHVWHLGLATCMTPGYMYDTWLHVWHLGLVFSSHIWASVRLYVPQNRSTSTAQILSRYDRTSLFAISGCYDLWPPVTSDLWWCSELPVGALLYEWSHSTSCTATYILWCSVSPETLCPHLVYWVTVVLSTLRCICMFVILPFVNASLFLEYIVSHGLPLTR